MKNNNWKVGKGKKKKKKKKEFDEFFQQTIQNFSEKLTAISEDNKLKNEKVIISYSYLHSNPNLILFLTSIFFFFYERF